MESLRIVSRSADLRLTSRIIRITGEDATCFVRVNLVQLLEKETQSQPQNAVFPAHNQLYKQQGNGSSPHPTIKDIFKSD
jgi:hypothetical protein